MAKSKNAVGSLTEGSHPRSPNFDDQIQHSVRHAETSGSAATEGFEHGKHGRKSEHVKPHHLQKQGNGQREQN